MYTKASIVTRTTHVGEISIGGNTPICIQTMTNTNTLNTEQSVLQIIETVNAGAQMVRLTAQGIAEAENLKNIKSSLRAKGYNTPLVADIHFNPKAAEIAAQHVEKVRINPGNYVDRYHKDKIEFTPQEYNQELIRIEKRLHPLIEICRAHNTALRIGSNHGSLSQRIMSRYGDSAEGMAISALEFLQICNKLHFHNIVVSMKSSNVLVMIEATKRIHQLMREENILLPIHLGVTEAGDALDGRIKSAFGIGALLLQGIGNTIRVSLTESPVKEIPVCKDIITIVNAHKNFIDQFQKQPLTHYKRDKYKNIGGNSVPVVIASRNNISDITPAIKPDYIYHEQGFFPVLDALTIKTIDDIENVLNSSHKVIIIENDMEFQWQVLHILQQKHILTPVILKRVSNEKDITRYAITTAVELSLFLNYRYIDGIWLENNAIPLSEVLNIAFSTLQAGRNRISKTDFISCPSCGRTLFDIEATLQKVKKATNHLTGLKIAVMGCVVNGPGEMADADYGYVGAGQKKVSLYKGKEIKKTNINETNAINELIALIKDEGDWIEP